MDAPLTRVNYRGCIPPASGLYSGRSGLHSGLSGLHSSPDAGGLVNRGVHRSQVLSTFLLLFYYPYDAVDKLTLLVSSRLRSLSLVCSAVVIVPAKSG